MPDLTDTLKDDPSIFQDLVDQALASEPIKPDLAIVRNRIKSKLVKIKLKDGTEKPSKTWPENVSTILSMDPEFGNKIWYNDWSHQIYWEDRELESKDATEIRIKIGQLYGFSPTKTLVDEIIDTVAKWHRKNPLTGWLRTLRWDGTERISTWLTRGVGAEDSELNRDLSRKFLVSMIARAMEPGCKADTVLVLVGGQGAGKSTTLEVLAGVDYFCDSPLEIGSRRAPFQIAKFWLYELSEWASVRRQDNNTMKAFASARFDTAFRPYGNRAETLARHTIFCGSTNNPQFLNDSTGARRFWPVTIGDIDLEYTRQVREQLFAEAITAYRAGEKWYLEEAMEQELEQRHEIYYQHDSWTGEVERWANTHGRGGFTTSAILKGAINLELHRMTRGMEARIGDLLRRLGYDSEPRDGETKWLKAGEVVDLEEAKKKKEAKTKLQGW